MTPGLGGLGGLGAAALAGAPGLGGLGAPGAPGAAGAAGAPGGAVPGLGAPGVHPALPAAGAAGAPGGAVPGLGAPGVHPALPAAGAPGGAVPHGGAGLGAAAAGAGLLTAAANQELQQNQILKDHKKRLTEYKIKLENALEEAQEKNTGITREVWTRLPLLSRFSTYYPDLAQQIVDLQQKIASLTQEIRDIDRILALGTAQKSEAVGVLVLQETCRDLEEKINAAKVKIGDREISIAEAATFTCTHILAQGQPAVGTVPGKTLALHHQEITKAYTERRNKWEAIQTLLR